MDLVLVERYSIGGDLFHFDISVLGATFMLRIFSFSTFTAFMAENSP